MIRVLIVSETRLFGEGLREVLGRTGTIEAVALATLAPDATRLAREHTPDVVLVDMSITDVLRHVRALREQAQRIVALGMPADEEMVIACANIGVDGYVCRSAGLAELVEALTVVAVDGGHYCDASLTAVAFRCIANERKQLHTRRAPPERSQGALLTTREHEVAALLMQGLANKQIAKRLSIGVSTVKNHVHSILTKTGASSRLEAAVALGSLQPRQSG